MVKQPERMILNVLLSFVFYTLCGVLLSCMGCFFVEIAQVDFVKQMVKFIFAVKFLIGVDVQID